MQLLEISTNALIFSSINKKMRILVPTFCSQKSSSFLIENNNYIVTYQNKIEFNRQINTLKPDYVAIKEEKMC